MKIKEAEFYDIMMRVGDDASLSKMTELINQKATETIDGRQLNVSFIEEEKGKFSGDESYMSGVNDGMYHILDALGIPTF